MTRDSKRGSWECKGDGKIEHPLVENYGDKCNFSACSQTRPQIQTFSPWLLYGAIAGIGCLFIFAIWKIFRSPSLDRNRFFYGGSTAFEVILDEGENQEKLTRLIARQLNVENLHLLYRNPVPDTKPGSGTGIQLLLEGELSFAHSSRPIRREEIKEAKERGVNLEQFPVAIDGIAIYVNPQIDVSRLTLTQVSKLFKGEISNWRSLDSITQAVKPVSLSFQTADIFDFFHRDVMGAQPFSSETIEVRNPTTAIRTVSSTPGAIGYASAALVCGQVTVQTVALENQQTEDFVEPCISDKVNVSAFSQGIYPIIRHLYVIIKNDNNAEESPEEKVGRAYIDLLKSPEGQTLLEQSGFAKIYGN